jgi:hypothetical protein
LRYLLIINLAVAAFLVIKFTGAAPAKFAQALKGRENHPALSLWGIPPFVTQMPLTPRFAIAEWKIM